MAVSIYALKRGLADVAIQIGEEELHVTYRPGVITVGFNVMSDNWTPWWLAEAVEKWDLVDDQGQPVPLRATKPDAPEYKEPSGELLTLPLDALVHIRREIVRDLMPGKRWRATSAGG